MWACKNNSIDVVKIITDINIDVIYQSDKKGQTGFLYAVSKQLIETIKCIILKD